MRPAGARGGSRTPSEPVMDFFVLVVFRRRPRARSSPVSRDRHVSGPCSEASRRFRGCPGALVQQSATEWQRLSQIESQSTFVRGPRATTCSSTPISLPSASKWQVSAQRRTNTAYVRATASHGHSGTTDVVQGQIYTRVCSVAFALDEAIKRAPTKAILPPRLG